MQSAPKPTVARILHGLVGGLLSPAGKAASTKFSISVARKGSRFARHDNIASPGDHVNLRVEARSTTAVAVNAVFRGVKTKTIAMVGLICRGLP